MIVAISQRNMKMDKGANRDALENDYVQYYERFGITLLPIPNVSKNLEIYFEKFPVESIILTGGNDVNPELYGAKVQKEDFSKKRDETEKKLVEIAIRRNLPLLAECRGCQFINVFFGGGLVQDVKSKTGANHTAINHKVRITEKEIAEFLNTKEFMVNSYHNQGIDESTLSPKLKAFAVTEDNSIEGIYHPKCPIAGVLWHPEREGCDKMVNERLVKAFIDRRIFWEK